MNITKKLTAIGSLGLALVLSYALVQSPALYGQPPAGGAPKGPDPRVQQRTYHFADTNEELPYALFVSSKVSKDKKNPLIVALHGVFGDGNSLLRGSAIDLAEEGGYILVGPMGYNPQGWFGSPVIVMNGGPGKGKGPGAAKGGPPPTPEPPNLAELSEKDVLNVLAIMRKEFTVDDKRTYLMGHSMGGAGALFLGPKHVDQWAAVASMAPAAFLMQPESLTPVKDKMPLLLAHGDADTVVPVDVGRRWAKTATDLKMKDFKYMELPGADHGTVITQTMPEIFKFFKAHSR
ncbi:MAG: alpha/beta hydrolase-fold protein [Acidobacteriota bacterium]